LLGFILGSVLGAHALAALQLTIYIMLWERDDVGDRSRLRLRLLWQWCTYVTALCTFHLLEFFVTAFYNPAVTSADSYLVNHSQMYTASALSSWTEFWLRFCFFPTTGRCCMTLSWIGLVLIVVSQTIRSTAMATAGESFNHYIQTSRKENHALVTHGIYRYLRHPSYVGFYYWCIGTQLLLGNFIHATAFAIVSWRFFMKRIAYEEDTLCRFFPDDYPDYVARSYMGIPFLFSQIDPTKSHKKKK